jgi:hypothetical protein
MQTDDRNDNMIYLCMYVCVCVEREDYLCDLDVRWNNIKMDFRGTEFESLKCINAAH